MPLGIIKTNMKNLLTFQISGNPTYKLLSVILALTISLTGCAKVKNAVTDVLRPELIIPVFDPDATIMPQTGTVIYVKNGIVAMAVPLNEEKNVDAFAILLHNKTNHWISFKKAECRMLDQARNIIKPLDKSQESFYFKKNYKPKLPPEFAADVFRWDKTIRVQGGAAALPMEDLEKTNVMPMRQSLFYLYFRKRSTTSKNLRIIIPGVTSGFNDQQTTFVFKFRVQRG